MPHAWEVALIHAESGGLRTAASVTVTWEVIHAATGA